NFMVKAIAEENKIEMPSFFGYMIKFSLIVLLPVYILTQLIFL
ncbi:MAG: sodium:proton antiporter, partial [Paludibacteraceae bacterium]|nr:sodium:proton antiporter [Paludibacteraceae bacterium]